MVTYIVIKTKVTLLCLKMNDFIYEIEKAPAAENEAICIFDNSRRSLIKVVPLH